VTVSLKREITAAVKPPRALYLRWPFGHPFGEAGARAQQLHVLLAVLALVEDVTEPGTIVDSPWRWRRETWSDPLVPAPERDR